MSNDSLRGPVLLTGAAGFIGSHAACALLSRGIEVVGIDNFDPFYPRGIKEANLQAVHAAGGRFTFVEGDICDGPLVSSLLNDHRVAAVIHLAAKAGVRPSIVDPPGYARANVLGTSVVLDAAHRAGCERVVVASSSSVYGNAPVAPFHEEMDVDAPISPYAATKRACELICRTHHHLTRQPVACLRFFTVYGPRQRPDLAISAFMRKIAAGETLQVFGDGSTSRDYTFVTDIVAGILASLERIPAHGYRVWNLGNSSPVTLSAMIEAIEGVVGRKAVVERMAMQPGDVERTWADLARSTRELGYLPATPFVEGLEAQWRAMSRAMSRA